MVSLKKNLFGPTARISILVATGLMAAACSTSPGGSSGASDAPGVTDDTITLGIISDFSGVYASLSAPPAWGLKVWADEVNANGGVCDRQVEFIQKDHKSDLQTGVSAYASVKDKVLAIPLMANSAVVAALSENFIDDDMLMTAGSWSSILLQNPNIAITGATYDVEMINGVGYLLDQGTIAEGDTIGHVYVEGEFGEGGVMGTEFMAEKTGLKVVKQQIKPTDSDMTSQVSSLKSAGAKAIFVTAGAKQMAAVAAVASSMDFNVPVVTVHNGYLRDLLSTDARSALLDNTVVVDTIGLFDDAESEKSKEVAAAFAKEFPDSPGGSLVNWGYSTGEVYGTILSKACEDGDLTRKSVLEAYRSLDSIESSFLPALNYSEPGELPTRHVFIAKPADNASGLTVLEDDYATPEVEEYTSPAS